MPAMPGATDYDDIRSSSYRGHSRSRAGSYDPEPSRLPYGQSAGLPYPMDAGVDFPQFPAHDGPGFLPPPGPYRSPTPSDDGDLAYGDEPPLPPAGTNYGTAYMQEPDRSGNVTTRYKYTPQAASDSRSASYSTRYQPQQKYEYAQPPEKLTYTSRPQLGQHVHGYSQTPQELPREQLSRSYSESKRDVDPRVVDITPDSGKREKKHSKSRSKSSRLSVDTKEASSLQAPPSPGLDPYMGRLSVSGNRPDLGGAAGGMGPPSPLLEAYHGTYQSISPMPLAIRTEDTDLSELEPLSPERRKKSKKGSARFEDDVTQSKSKKRAIVYDSEADAKAIASALNHTKPDPDPIIDVLPPLTHDQILALRKEYKKQVKIQGKGINLSKHIKLKLTGNFGKAAYVTALGRWESEGYWANFWYQSHSSRRELLIESLMGRSNVEVRSIKDDFKDKRYSDSLQKCMEKELKMDKFRTAVLMVLEERRQEEHDVYPLEYLDQDVEILRKAVRASQGGETAMLEIVVRRSDSHLRGIMRAYDRAYGENFARAALKKSNNLVVSVTEQTHPPADRSANLPTQGEVIAHILNGVINKPARDALLLNHAIEDIAARNKSDELRYELLISRLVRLHWDRLHLAKVKREYAEKYRRGLEEDIEQATSGDFREFMCELCR